jgi:hypothetical protein
LLCAALSLERLARLLVRIEVSKTGFTGFSTPITQKDRTRNRNDNSAYNRAILRHMGLNRPQQDRLRVSLRSQLSRRSEGRLPSPAAFCQVEKAA